MVQEQELHRRPAAPHAPHCGHVHRASAALRRVAENSSPDLRQHGRGRDAFFHCSQMQQRKDLKSGSVVTFGARFLVWGTWDRVRALLCRHCGGNADVPFFSPPPCTAGLQQRNGRWHFPTPQMCCEIALKETLKIWYREWGKKKRQIFHLRFEIQRFPVGEVQRAQKTVILWLSLPTKQTKKEIGNRRGERGWKEKILLKD